MYQYHEGNKIHLIAHNETDNISNIRYNKIVIIHLVSME